MGNGCGQWYFYIYVTKISVILQLIHFSDKIKTDIFRADDSDMQKRMMEASETFLKGSTDFEKPIKKAISLIQDEKWNNADIVFITDGICNLSDECEKYD